ncbi:hypothetical protein AOLI_G00003630 [Acnodon oligacanthus]
MVQDLKSTSARDSTSVCDLDQRHFPFEWPPIISRQKKILVLELGLISGADIKDTVWRILKQTIKNDLTKPVSWRGLNGKTAFQSLQLKSVVTEAVRRNPLCA